MTSFTRNGPTGENASSDVRAFCHVGKKWYEVTPTGYQLLCVHPKFLVGLEVERARSKRGIPGAGVTNRLPPEPGQLDLF